MADPTPLRSAGDDRQQVTTKKKGWLKRIGWIGFFFFLIKGLIWLAVFFGVGKLVT